MKKAAWSVLSQQASSHVRSRVHIVDPITVRPTSSGLLTYYYYFFGLFWIIFYPFPIIKLSPFYLITSPVPTCLVHNCEASRRLFYFHLLLSLSQDQIPFDPHHLEPTARGVSDFLGSFHHYHAIYLFCFTLFQSNIQ